MLVTEERQGKTSARMCAGCRQRDERDALVRFAVCPEAPFLVADPTRKLGGRGVSVHATRACLEAAARRGGFARALGKKVSVDPNELAEQLLTRLDARVRGLLLAAARTRNIALGTDAVRGVLGDQRIQLLLVANDAAGRREELTRAADRLGRACAVFGTKQTLGQLFRREALGVIAILDVGIGQEIVRATSAMDALSEDR